MSDITWTNEQRRLSELIPWERNPRKIEDIEAQRLGKSLSDFGQVQTIAIGPDNSIYDGHQRQLVWSALDKFGPDYVVDVRMSSRLLIEKEREKLVIYLHKGTVADWDWEQLDTFELSDLQDWGFKNYELGIVDDPDDPNELWEGMPEFEQEDAIHRTIKVHFANDVDVEDFARLVGQNITDKTRFIWHPEQKLMDLKSMAVVDES